MYEGLTQNSSNETNIEAVKKARREQQNTTPKGVVPFFKGVGTIVVSLILHVAAAGAIMYSADKRNNELSLPTNQRRMPYTNEPQQGTLDLGKSLYEYKFSYGWPYNGRETFDSGNFISNWFSKMMITSWSSSRSILRETLMFFNTVSEMSEAVMILVAPIMFIVTWILSGFVGFFTTAYGSFQTDLLGMMTTFFTFIFGILFLICSTTAFLQSMMLIAFFILIPFMYQSGRQYIGGVFKRNSKFIGLLFALAVTLKAYTTLEQYIALGMAIGFGLIFLKAYFF